MFFGDAPFPGMFDKLDASGATALSGAFSPALDEGMVSVVLS